MLKTTHLALPTAALLLQIGLSSSMAMAQDSGNGWGNGGKWGAKTAPAAKSGKLPETELLKNNDALLPGQNRTQAMRLEAETGGITPYADSQLKPMLKRQTNIPPRYVLKNKAAQRKIQTTPFIGHGVTAGSSKVVTHTGAAASGKH